MNLVEAFKQIGRDIKGLVTRTDSVEKSIEELKKTSTATDPYKELEEATGVVGMPPFKLPFYLVKNHESGGIELYDFDNPPFVIDPETKEATWLSSYEWTYDITSQSLLGFELFSVPEDMWERYNDSKNKAEDNERKLVTRTFGSDEEKGLWYVDDDGHFQRLVDTIIELKKEIAELKGKQNHE